MGVFNKAMTIFLLKLLIMSNMAIICKSFSFPTKVTVAIVNDLKNNMDLGLHCKSADDDLGSHWLRHSAEYSFNFKIRLIGTTQFYCHFIWKEHSEWFDIYIQIRDSCDHCVWKIRETGPCLQGNELTCFPWNHKTM